MSKQLLVFDFYLKYCDIFSIIFTDEHYFVTPFLIVVAFSSSQR